MLSVVEIQVHFPAPDIGRPQWPFFEPQVETAQAFRFFDHVRLVAQHSRRRFEEPYALYPRFLKKDPHKRSQTAVYSYADILVVIRIVYGFRIAYDIDYTQIVVYYFALSSPCPLSGCRHCGPFHRVLL